ncbi:MAG: glycine cleavage system protein [Rhodospirillales bacterium]|nr:glycine cleavage system protein [Rhodospirillales bacterium]
MPNLITSGPKFAVLPARAPLILSGPDAVSFVQGLVSNDVEKATPGQAVYAALLTAQGKFLFDFFVAALPEISGGGLVLEAEAARLADLAKRLKLYKLRAKVAIEPAPDLVVAAVWGEGCERALSVEGIAYVDPRLAAAGVRLILPAHDAVDLLRAAGFAEASEADYDAHRLSYGLPDGSRDMEVDKAVLLECGFEELHGVDFAKGCYMGQELTARTKYRGLVKKRLMPVVIEGETPPPGTPITLDGRDAGELRSVHGKAGIALIRLDAFDKARIEGMPLMAGAVPLSAWTPEWMSLPEKE